MMAKTHKPPRKGRTATPPKPDAARGDEAPISAQVLLKTASTYGGEPVTAETISAAMPTPQEVAAITAEFLRRGFEVGPVVGLSFSVTAPPRAFEEMFDLRLPRRPSRRLDLNPEGHGYELPLDRLLPRIARGVQAVVFTPPPDFGPVQGGY
jgi:hypothetical protein